MANRGNRHQESYSGYMEQCVAFLQARHCVAWLVYFRRINSIMLAFYRAKDGGKGNLLGTHSASELLSNLMQGVVMSEQIHGKLEIRDSHHLRNTIVSLGGTYGDVLVGGPLGGFGHRGRLIIGERNGRISFRANVESDEINQICNTVLGDNQGRERVRISNGITGIGKLGYYRTFLVLDIGSVGVSDRANPPPQT